MPNRVGHPIEQVLIVMIIAPANVLTQVREVSTTVARYGFAGEARPEIEIAAGGSTRGIDDRVVLAPLRVFNPPLPESHDMSAGADSLLVLVMERAEIGN